EFLARNLAGIRSAHFMCGPHGFMSTIEEALKDMGVADERIHRESFTVPDGSSQTANKLSSPGAEEAGTAETDKATAAGQPQVPKNAILIGDKDAISAPETLEVNLEGETHSLPYNSGSSVLETLLEAGLNPPYSCRDGGCIGCIGKVEAGLVYQDDMGILSDDTVDASESLTCQARPLSKKVKIKYELF